MQGSGFRGFLRIGRNCRKGSGARHPEKVGDKTQLQQEVPILLAVQRLIEAAAIVHVVHQAKIEQYGLQRDIGTAQKADRVAVDAPACLAVIDLPLLAAGISGAAGRLFAQRGH
ncbi:MAG: hypothetical protein CAPSK01_003492 [Candidatus Accumulibacter vicinus]|uniref:Uncharacterized protein n=1 Tax=Candidatus Accumulibacter vicinus TaxID=2954382 RepID=A0A084XXD5_9PROT|nr:MAG: hypothetical protein CAPSK01_003492 [Candidatus Accumulibacter vicinus]